MAPMMPRVPRPNRLSRARVMRVLLERSPMVTPQVDENSA
jgi:hypothetical protein